MVTICSKNFCKPTIQDIMLAKIRKKRENESIEQFFQRLKQQREEGNSKILSGTTIPNSTFKSFLAENNGSALSVKQKNEKTKSSSSISSKQSRASSLKSIKINTKEKEDSSATVKSEEKSRASFILETSTMEELKELRDLLHKSSYVPKKTKTRRSTIEKIKSAIEKEKQNLNHKNESTVNVSAELSDASTETEKKKKKRTTDRKKSVNSVKKGSSTSRSIDTGTSTVQVGKKGKKRKKKITNNIDVEIQCSILQVKTNE